MKKTLKIALSTTLLASASFIATNAVAACNGASPACPSPIWTNHTLSFDCQGPINVRGSKLTLNLAGHTVCNAVADGIDVTGNRVTIKNGYVKNNGDSAIWMQGNKGKIENINASKNADYRAILVDGRKVTILNSYLHNNDTGGVYLYSGSKYATVINNTIKHNDGSGIDIESKYATVTNNTIKHNSVDGIAVDHDGGLYWLNHANSNGYSGIYVYGGATSNSFYFNSATSNTDDDLYDNNACGSNAWYFNTWNTKNKACIE